MRPFAESFISRCRCCLPLFCGDNRCMVSADAITFCSATCISWRRGDHRGWRGLLRSPARPRTLLLVPNRATAVTNTHTHFLCLSFFHAHTHTCVRRQIPAFTEASSDQDAHTSKLLSLSADVVGLSSTLKSKSFNLALPGLDAYVAVRVLRRNEEDVLAMTVGCANASVCMYLVQLLRDALVKSQKDKFSVENSTPLSLPTKLSNLQR